MKAELLGLDAVEWASFLRANGHAFYHLPAYVALCAAQENGTPCALHVADGTRRMLLPLIIRPIPGGAFDATSPYGYPGPLVNGASDQTFFQSALIAGASTLRSRRIVSAFVRLHPLFNASFPDGFGTLVQHGDTVSVDLSLPADELWAQTRQNHRRDITRALALGYVARMDEGLAHYDAFKDLYGRTMERRSAAPFYHFDDRYWNGLRDALGRRMHLCVVERDGQIAAAGLFVETRGLVQYHLSGTIDGSSRVQPTKLMIQFVRGWAKERGDLWLHLGGGVGAESDSLMRFKLGFSTIRHPFRTLRIVLDEPEYRRLVSEHSPFLDPDARDGFFPLYRSDVTRTGSDVRG